MISSTSVADGYSYGPNWLNSFPRYAIAVLRGEVGVLTWRFHSHIRVALSPRPAQFGPQGFNHISGLTIARSRPAVLSFSSRS